MRAAFDLYDTERLGAEKHRRHVLAVFFLRLRWRSLGIDAAFLADGALQELGTVDVMFAPNGLPKIGKNVQKHGEKHGKICRISLEKAEKCAVILLYRKC